MNEKFKIAIVGAGPGGLSAAARAAELGVSHILIEAAPHIANTIHRYQKGKLVMAEPAQLPLRSTLSFGAGIREQILDTWRQEIDSHRVNVRVGAAVSAILGQRGDFQIKLASGDVLTAEFVVLAIGLQGNIRKPSVPGEDLPGVQYQLDDPDEYNNEAIVVVGGGDAGVENAMALAKQNRVILINRQEEFNNCKETNFALLMEAVTAGKLETRVNTRAERVDALSERDFPLAFVVQTSQGIEQIECHRIIVRLGANPPRKLVESFGVRFPNDDPASVPQLSEQYESNVPGMYIVGALAGYPLIKQAMNQGYEVVEYILGNPVEPADEALLRRKFAGVPGIVSAGDGIALIKRNMPLFASLTTLQLREFMLDSAVGTPRGGEVLFQQNDYSNSFFSILEGNVKIQISVKDGATLAFTMGRGDFFGEMGLLSGRRRSGTAIAGENCVLVETPRRSMLKLLQAASGVQRKLDEVSLARIIRNALDSTLLESEINLLVHEAKFKRYETGEALFHEGDKADGLYMIKRGSVTVSRLVEGKDVVLAYVSAGNYVGEMALTSDMPRSATVRAAAPTEVVLLDAGRFKAVMERNSSIRSKVDSRHLERVRSNESETTGETSGLIKFLMDQGMGEATDVLLIDYSRCIRCDNCESACADVHDGASRLNREAGPTHEHIHVPASCRHCEHPHCMKDCPPDAIHRSLNGEVFIGDGCIGCGNCRNNCPYGVIQMAASSDYKRPGVWQIISGKRKQPGAWNQPCGGDKAAGRPAKKAVKCDMCKNIIAEPACVRACPTGAASRVSPEDFLGLVKHGNDGQIRTGEMQRINLLKYKNYRYLKIACLLAVIAMPVYVFFQPARGEFYGGTWLGYALGMVSMLIILLLVWYGISKRRPQRAQERRQYQKLVRRNQQDASVQQRYPASKRKKADRRKAHARESQRYGWTLQGWLSAHIYLGTSLIVLATLHTGFQFGWNVHTLSYVLMVLVIASGIYGMFAYLNYPRMITRNMGEDTFDGLLLKIAELDELARIRALGLSDEVNALVLKARLGTRLGGNLFQQLSGIRRDCPTDLAVQQILALGEKLVMNDQPKLLRDLYSVLLQKQKLVRRARNEIMLKARMQAWLYLHAPLSIALLAALFAHIVAIFYYW
jgi:CRP-like cAMP-binding protein/thioredoxin reductase